MDPEKKNIEEDVKREHIADEPSSAARIQERFDLLRDLSNEEMESLNKRVVNKLDWRLMPCITLMFLMSYLDRINVSNARLAGLQADLHMSDTVWNTGISTFYIGYLVGQLPGNIWLSKSRPSIFLPATMLSLIMPAHSGYGVHSAYVLGSGVGFALCRFFTGLCEAPFFPGITLLTSSWYNKYESPTRMAVWHAGNTISNIISGFLAAGILTKMDNIANLTSWQWFFLIEGAASMVVAMSSFFLLPDWPHDTKFLTEEEKEMAQYRILVSNGGHDKTVCGTWDGLKDAVKDPFTWYFCGVHFALVTAQSFKDFLPSIMETFNFDETTTYLVQAPPYAIAYAASCLLAYTSGRFQESCYHIIGPIFLSAVGTSVLISSLNVGARYFGIILLISGTYSGLNLQLSWETTLVPAPRAKKAALIAIANCISQVSHWFSPYFFPTSQEPFYRLGGGLILFGCFMTAVLVYLIKLRAMKLNKLLDESEGWSAHTGNERGWRFSY